MPCLARLLLPIVGLLLVGCASTATGHCRSTARAASDRIDAARLQATGAHDVHDALRLIRPRMLGTRAPRKDAPVVYVDGVRVGHVAYLRRLPVREIESIRRLGGPDATTRYGTDHVGGALLVTTRLGTPTVTEGCRG
ncbi:MAG: Plug domain-containing protein [Gemmatimonadota bacterium]|jgi:hypothetical protein